MEVALVLADKQSADCVTCVAVLVTVICDIQNFKHQNLSVLDYKLC